MDKTLTFVNTTWRDSLPLPLMIFCEELTMSGSLISPSSRVSLARRAASHANSSSPQVALIPIAGVVASLAASRFASSFIQKENTNFGVVSSESLSPLSIQLIISCFAFRIPVVCCLSISLSLLLADKGYRVRVPPRLQSEAGLYSP